LVFLTALLLVVGLLAPGASVGAEKLKIGILLSGDDPRYVEAAEAAVKQLKAEGYDESRLTVETQSAKGDAALAAKLARQFASDGVRLVLTMGTAATAGAVAELKDLPIIIGIVWDPVESGFAKGWASSGNNVTGSSNKVRMASVVTALKQLGPVQRLGVLFNPAEKNSALQLAEFKALKDAHGFVVVEIPITKGADVAATVRQAATGVDTMALTGAVTVISHASAIVAIAAECHIPTVTTLIDVVEAGALIGVTASLQEVGRLTGAKAAQVLRGAKPASIPIEIPKRFDVAVNLKTATATGVKVPADLLKSATRVIR
jgi:putative ABC transport system substrate-binding protein